MTPDRWQLVKEVLAEVLAQDEQQRASYLEKACLNDTSLRAQVESLLKHYEQAQAQAFLQHSELGASSPPRHCKVPSETASEHSSSTPDANRNPRMDEPLASPSQLPLHGRLGGHEILETVAEGGMGVVYKARHIGLNRIVALKTIRAGQLASAQDVARFRAEAEATANLEHPNIVPVYEVGEQDGQHYYSMGFVDGRSLAERLAEGPLPEREVAKLVKTVADAVHYAHQSGLVHRDLKPGNILLTATGDPRVTDFGIAKRLDDDSSQTRTGMVLGTPSYMSPEQVAGSTKELGPATDVYALGAILYETLVGRPPFQGTSVVETLQQVRSDEPPIPRALKANVSRDLETICLKCLQKKPADRYPTARALADDLERYLNRISINARRGGSIAQLWKWTRRYPAVTAAGSCALVALIATVLVVFITVGPKSRQRDENRRTTTATGRDVGVNGNSVGAAAEMFPNLEILKAPILRGLDVDFLRWIVPIYEESLREKNDDPDAGPQTEDSDHFLRIAADASVHAKDWENAVVVFKKMVEIRDDNVNHWHDLAIALLANQDVNGYRKVCADMMERFRASQDNEVADRIVYTSVAAGDAVPSLHRLVPLAKKSVDLWGGNIRVLGAVEYRLGNYTEAVQHLEKNHEDQRRAWDWFFLAMAHHQLSHVDQSRDCLQRGHQRMLHAQDMGWTEQVEVRHLRQEAEDMMQQRQK